MRKLLEALISVPATIQYSMRNSSECEVEGAGCLGKSISDVTYQLHAGGCTAGGTARWSPGVARR